MLVHYAAHFVTVKVCTLCLSTLKSVLITNLDIYERANVS